MSVWSYLRQKITRSSLKRGEVTISTTWNPNQKDVFIVKTEYDPASAARTRDQDRRSLPLHEQLKKLSWEDQTISHGVWSTVRGASQKYWVALKDSRGRNLKNEHKKKEKLMAVLGQNSRGSVKFDFHVSFEAIRQQMLRSVKLYGVIAAEAVLDAKRQPAYIKVINPNTIKFKEPDSGNYVPYQEVSAAGLGKTEIKLDYPSFFWVRLDPDTDTPYARSPMESVVNTIYFQISFLEDLQEVVKKTAWPRISAKLMENVMYESLPEEIKNNPKKHQEFMDASKLKIAQVLQELKPGQAFVSGDYVELSVLESSGQNKGTLDAEPLLKVIERQSAQAMKTYGSVLGVDQSVDPLQQFMEGRSLEAYQSTVEDAMSQILTFFYRTLGMDVIATFKHCPQELRPESELEPARSQKFATNYKLLAMGVMTPEEFSVQMTGTPLPHDSALEDLYNDPELAVQLLGGKSEAPGASDTDSSGKAPAKPDDEDDGRSDPDASSKKGKTPAKKRTGEVKTTRRGTSRKPRRK